MNADLGNIFGYLDCLEDFSQRQQCVADEYNQYQRADSQNVPFQRDIAFCVINVGERQMPNQAHEEGQKTERHRHFDPGSEIVHDLILSAGFIILRNNAGTSHSNPITG